MSFEDDARWDEAIALISYLSLKQWTGVFWFRLLDGRLDRRTVEQLQFAKRQADKGLSSREETAHAARG